MKSLATFSLLTALLFLGACASQILGQHVGQTLSEPVRQYGPPAYSYSIDADTRAFVWTKNTGLRVPDGSIYRNEVVNPPQTIETACSYIFYARKTVPAPQSPSDWSITEFRDPSLGCQ